MRTIYNCVHECIGNASPERQRCPHSEPLIVILFNRQRTHINPMEIQSEMPTYNLVACNKIIDFHCTVNIQRPDCIPFGKFSCTHYRIIIWHLVPSTRPRICVRHRNERVNFKTAVALQNSDSNTYARVNHSERLVSF